MGAKLLEYATRSLSLRHGRGLARPFTTLPPSAPPVVDGRHKAGHDTTGTQKRHQPVILTPLGRCPALWAVPGGQNLFTLAGSAKPVRLLLGSGVVALAG